MKLTIVKFPTGTGKTRAVLKDVRSKKGKLLVLVPNERVKERWMKDAKIMKLNKIIIKSHSKFSIPKGVTAVAIDEWHRLSESKSKKIGKRLLRSNTEETYLISATPVNPVLEDLNIEKDTEDESEKAICEAISKTVRKISCLLHEPHIDVEDVDATFEEILKMRFGRQIHFMNPNKASKWKRPDPYSLVSNIYLTLNDLHFKLPVAKEYASCNGKFSTIKKHQEYFIKKDSKSSFSYKYSNDHLFWEKNISKENTLNVLKNKYKFKHLKAYLEELPDKHVVIFCTHRGIARAVAHFLEHNLDKKRARKIFFGKNEDKFNGCKDYDQMILVATDAMSEGIDLHNQCQHLIHFELPWSPLRIMQRVGRLTRYKNGAVQKAYIHHIVSPYSTEEEIINRLVRRFEYLNKRGLIPGTHVGRLTDGELKKIVKGLIGLGSSEYLKAWLGHQTKQTA